MIVFRVNAFSHLSALLSLSSGSSFSLLTRILIFIPIFIPKISSSPPLSSTYLILRFEVQDSEFGIKPRSNSIDSNSIFDSNQFDLNLVNPVQSSTFQPSFSPFLLTFTPYLSLALFHPPSSPLLFLPSFSIL